jgi:hypothetical protein
MKSGELACYLYCLTRAGGGFDTAVVGVDGRRPVLARDCAGVGAIYGEVELDEFVGPDAEQRLQDLAWLGPRVCRHEAVIEQAMSRAAVLPVRFATLFTSRQSMENNIAARREAIADFFSRLGDRQEWSVKGQLDRAAAREGELESVGRLTGEKDSSPGARYFQQKRLEAEAEREFNRRLREFCRQAAAALGEVAGGFRERKVLPAGEVEVVLNWAFLLAPARIGAFQTCLDRLNGCDAFPGLRLALTGPWPPFSFAPDLSAGARQ